MIYSVIFAEGGMGGLIYVVIGVIAAIGFAIGIGVTIITLIYNSIKKIDKPSKYYLMVFGTSFLIGLLVTGMICGATVS